MKFVFVLAIFIVCAGAVTIHQVKNTRQCKTEGGICKQTCAVDEEDTGPCCRNSYRCCQPPTCNDTLQYAECKAKNGKSKPVCDVNEQDTGIGPFCNTNRCCEPPTCIASVDCNCKSSTSNCHSKTEYQDNAGNCSGSDKCCKPCCDTLQYAECKAKNGKSKPVCDVNEQDTGIGPFCNTNRCCEPPTCIASVDCNCKSSTSNCHSKTEYQDNAGNCSGSDKCCKPCCVTCGGTFKGPEGSFTSPHYPSNYCNLQICSYTIIVEEGSKVMLNFTFVELEPYFADTVKVYDGDIETDTLMANLHGGPFEGLEFNSTSNKMLIVFKSDGSNVLPGFSAIYKALQ